MILIKKIIVGMLILIGFISLTAAAQEAPKIESIHVQLFYDRLGTFSSDITVKKDLTLWNTVIGEGGAGGASTATLVTVEVSGKNISIDRGAKVSIVATNSRGKKIQSTQKQIAIYDDYRRIFVPLMLTETGCEKIKVTATLSGKLIKQSSMSKIIPFECGE